ncbi:sugar transferase [Limisphaera ngatamarikiensis]|nr:sugar transferase [Limisphaera ngatamarikiensis]
MPEQTQAITLSMSRDGADDGPLPVWKRALDLFCILVSLPVTLPLGLAIAAYIKLVSPGPVLFRQERIGYRGQRFWCLKFRTMRVNADTSCHQQHLKSLLTSDAPMIKLDVKGDPRLIRGGAFLRATGLDELPQLINVLRGEMSLVGPRPCLPYEYEQYDDWARQRCEAVPGLTGLWQVSGKNHTTFRRMIELDIQYARTKSLWLDLRIMAKTFSALAAQVRETRAAVRTPAASSPTHPAVPAANGAAKAA